MVDSRNTHSVKTCHVCGDTGFREKIVTCFQCQITQEHVYCMPVLLSRVPKIWICEACQSSKGKDSQQSFIQTQFSKILTPLNSEIVYSDTMQSIVAIEFSENSGRLPNFPNETAISTGKLKFPSSEEVIEQLSGTFKVKNISSSGQGSSSGQSATITVSSSSAIGLKTLPSKFPNLVVKASPTSVKLKEHFFSTGHDRAESSLKVRKVGFTLQRLAELNKGQLPIYRHNQDKYAVKEEPADVPFPSRRVESMTSRVRKAIKFTYSPSMDFQSVTHSGRRLHIDVQSKILGVQERDIPNILPKPEKYFPCHSTPKITWCGSLEVSYSVSHSEFFDGFRAYVPGGVHCKAFKFFKQMPGVLRCTMLPSSSLEVFKDGYPVGDDNAIYIFPVNFERSRWQYERLLLMLEMKDLVLISSLRGMELLVFPSKRLNMDFHDAGLGCFLCGLYRPMKSEVGVLSLPFCNAAPQAQSSNVHTKFKLRGNEGKVEQQQLSDLIVPPGFPVKNEVGVLPLPSCNAAPQAQSSNVHTKFKLCGNEGKVEQQQLSDLIVPPGFPMKNEVGVLPLPSRNAARMSILFKLLGNEGKVEQQQLNDPIVPPGFPSRSAAAAGE